MLGTHPRQEVSTAGRQQRWPRGDGAGPQPGTRQAPRGAAPGGFPFQWEAHLSSPGPRLVLSAPRLLGSGSCLFTLARAPRRFCLPENPDPALNVNFPWCFRN